MPLENRVCSKREGVPLMRLPFGNPLREAQAVGEECGSRATNVGLNDLRAERLRNSQDREVCRMPKRRDIDFGNVSPDGLGRGVDV
jgi:hypothetical protein